MTTHHVGLVAARHVQPGNWLAVPVENSRAESMDQIFGEEAAAAAAQSIARIDPDAFFIGSLSPLSE